MKENTVNRGLKWLSLGALCAASLFLGCEEGSATPGTVGNAYPHKWHEVTGSPYQATSDLESRAGIQRDVSRMRGPFVGAPQTALPVNTQDVANAPLNTNAPAQQQQPAAQQQPAQQQAPAGKK